MSGSTTSAPDQAAALARAVAVTTSQRWDVHERFPVVFEQADGAYAWGVDGRRYLDLTSCSGALPLGARHPEVRKATYRAVEELGGMLPGPISEYRTRVAQQLVDIFPCAQRAVFFRTGSCATAAAARLARVATGRRLVLTSGFHGWHDSYLQVKERVIEARDPETIDFGYSLERLQRTLETSGAQVAAVIVTPEVGYFPVPYYQALARLVRASGAVLIYDEVMTGFRYGVGGFHSVLGGGAPDLVTVSKGIANGTALSAVLGTAEIMDAFEETYLGNTYLRELTPFVIAEVTLPILTAGGAIDTMQARGSELLDGFNQVFAEHGIEAQAFGPSAMFDVIFHDDSLGREFYTRLLSDGVLLEYGGTHLVSAATTSADIQAVLASADRLAGELVGRQPAPAGRGGRVPFETLARNATMAINADPSELANWY